MRPAVRLLLSGAYCPESALLFKAMTVQPLPGRKAAYDRFIRTLKLNGIWQKLDLLYVLAAHDAQAARLNLVTPGVNSLTVTGTPVFAADQGYTGNGTDGRLDITGTWTPAQMGQDSAIVGVYTRTASSYDGATTYYGAYTGAGRLLRRPATEANIEWRINDGTSANTAVAAQTGHFAVRRSASNERSLWREGAQVTTNAQASTANSTLFHLFSANGAGFGDPQYSLAYAGSSLTDGQMVTMNTAIATLKAAIGF